MEPGSRLIRANIAFYAGVKAGAIAEVPASVADVAVRAGAAEYVETLDARLKGRPAGGAAIVYPEPPNPGKWIDPEPAVPEPIAEVEPPVVEVVTEPVPFMAKPKQPESKAAWVDYAVMFYGQDRGKVKAMTKAQVIILVRDLELTR